jgi:hypothetical protein
MITLPKHFEILDCLSSRGIQTCYVPLDPSLAKRTIDDCWWNGISDDDRENAQDGHWSWKWIAEEYGNDFENSCFGLFMPFDYCHAAMAYGINGQSVFSSGGAVVVHRASAAPYTRKNAPKRPFCRCGEGIIVYAVAASYSLNLGGVVNLDALDEAQSFYKKLGFKETGIVNDEMKNFEITADDAGLLLRKWGLLK